MTGHDTFDELVTAYALETLEREEVRAFEAHLSGCAVCQATLADLRRVSAGLGLAVERIEPPASLRARTLARATSQPQMASAASQTPARRQPAAASWSWLGMAALLTLAAGLGIYAGFLRSELATTRQLLADMSGRIVDLRSDLATARRDSTRLANTLDVLGSADVVRVDLRAPRDTPAATGRAYVSARGVVFNAERLPSLTAGRTYQLWVIPPGEGAAPVSAGLFGVDATGASRLAMSLPANVVRVAAVAVTEEPAGGSPKPTSAPLLVGTPINN